MYVLEFSSRAIENAANSKRVPERDHSRGLVWHTTYPANPLLQSPRIVGRPGRVLPYWQDQIDNATDRLARLVEDGHIRVRMNAVLACGFSSSRRVPEVAVQASRFPTHAGTQKALDDTTAFFERSDSIRP